MREALIARLTALGSLALDFYPDLASTDDPASGFALTVYFAALLNRVFPQRNRFTVLVETHSWKDYAHRVRVMRDTVVSLAELVAAHGSDWRQLALQADQAAMKLGGDGDGARFLVELARAGTGRGCHRGPGCRGGRTHDRVSGLRLYASAVEDFGGLVTTYDPATPQIWRVPLRDHVRASVHGDGAARRVCWSPWHSRRILHPRLEAHGIAFSRLRHAAKSIDAQAFRAVAVKFSAAPFEGRMRAQLTGGWHRRCNRPQEGALWVPIAQPLARLAVALFEPHAPDSLLLGVFNACFEQKEHMEPYVAERIAREMLEKDPRLAAEFLRKCQQDAEFAASPVARLEFFLRRHASWDARYNLYPVLRIQTILQ